MFQNKKQKKLFLFFSFFFFFIFIQDFPIDSQFTGQAQTHQKDISADDNFVCLFIFVLIFLKCSLLFWYIQKVKENCVKRMSKDRICNVRMYSTSKFLTDQSINIKAIRCHFFASMISLLCMYSVLLCLCVCVFVCMCVYMCILYRFVLSRPEFVFRFIYHQNKMILICLKFFNIKRFFFQQQQKKTNNFNPKQNSIFSRSFDNFIFI